MKTFKIQNTGTYELLNGILIYRKVYLPKLESDRLFQYLVNHVNWQQEHIKVYGKEIAIPRLTAWYGDPDMDYSYSGIKNSPKAWNAELLNLKTKVESVAGVNFNSVLLNRYRNGNDSVSWHSDDEPELGKNPIIASLNLGATRNFQLRHKETKERYDITLSHGDVLVMAGEMQHYWDHQIPKTKRLVDERINLTFRKIS